MAEKEEEARQKLRDKDCELMEVRTKNQERCVYYIIILLSDCSC